MKVKHLLSVALATCSLLTSCLSEPDFVPVVEDGIPINLNGSISQVSTKVNAQGFEDKDALGLYAVNYENSNQTPGVLLDKGNQADHVKYIFDESTWKWTPVRPVYYKDVNTNVDLYVFYPHAEPSSVNAYNFEVQKDQSQAEKSGRLSGYEASDFMWTKVENVTPTESAVKVTLQHKMAGVHVILQEGTGFEVAGDWDLLDKKVLVTNTTRKAVVDLSTGEVSPLGGAQATGIVMAPQTDGSFRAIVVPQTVQAGTPVLNITVGGVSYNFTKDASVTYTSGKLSQFTITVNRKTAAGDYEFVLTDTQILDWKEDRNTHEGEARQYYCVHCEEPGTLGDLIVADGKNPDKIKNLKVSGKIHAGDFAFMNDNMAILEAVNLKEARIEQSYKYYCDHLEGDSGYYYFSEPKTIDEIKQTYPEVSRLHWSNPETICIEGEIPPAAFSVKKTLTTFVFPEYIVKIGNGAFTSCTLLSGALVIPDDVVEIGNHAFEGTNISSLHLPHGLTKISGRAFMDCKALSGQLYLPNTLEFIGQYSFNNCKGLTGKLVLPENLTYLGSMAFYGCNGFVGDLSIPESLSNLYSGAFANCSGLNGYLKLHDNLTFNTGTGPYDGSGAGEFGVFQGCSFQGELVIPANIVDIPAQCFAYCNFTSVSEFPEGILGIGTGAFENCQRLSGILELPESLVKLDESAFSECGNLQGVVIPSKISVISGYAFKNCFYLNKIVSKSSVPPVIQSGAFDGVAKDNFTVEVPANAVKLYQADAIWGEFKRIEAHYDFSISRPLSRALNGVTSKNYILRAPADHDWSVESKPDWVTVTPSSGTGKAEVTITFAEMTDGEVGTFETELTDEWGNYQGTVTYAGRAGEIVFLLEDKDYRSTMTVEQYDYEYGDGDVMKLNSASEGGGVDLVFMGDCYDARDIASGDYLNDIQEAIGYYFDVEPYKTYKDYFNVYLVFGVSNDSGMGTVNTIRDAKFGSQYSLNGISPDFETAYDYAKKADAGINPAQTLVVLIENTTEYGGICYMWGDGTAIACCPKSADAYPYDFRGIVQHEAGGHGFGKLADEYIYHNAFIQSCSCTCCGHLDDLLAGKALGWYRNIEATGDVNEVGWSHLIFNPDYSDVVDVYEGGYFHSRGVYRSEPTSCMNNNIPYFSAISRQAIVERIMEYAGEEFTLENFYANDSDEFGATTKSAGFNTIPVETYFGGQQHPPVYMGDKPDFLK